MNGNFQNALAAGSERLAAWADLLDSINVFPIADGDTGRNLAISLTPLRHKELDREQLTHKLLLRARGNSGNISAQFFSGFLTCEGTGTLESAAKLGRDKAWSAVPDPKEGTILSFFNGLADSLEKAKPNGAQNGWEARVLDHLEEVVQNTSTQLPELQSAGVVDSGALGMFIFFDAFFNVLQGRENGFRPIQESFGDLISLNTTWQGNADHGYCIDAVVRKGNGTGSSLPAFQELGESLVHTSHGDMVKVHFHAASETEARAKLEQAADIVQWTSDDLEDQTRCFLSATSSQALHIMTDAAGSVTRRDARRLGITLLDSYVNIGTDSVPETHQEPGEVYKAMRSGAAVSTSQASNFEKHQCYQQAIVRFPKTLYLCVGSVYTGNFQTLNDWKPSGDPDNRLQVLDTGAASGRLGLIACATAKKSLQTKAPKEVVEYAKWAIEHCQEYIFLEKLQYLAAGGRMSKSGAFFGDLVGVKPIVSPTAEGVVKAGIVRTTAGQIKFTLEKIKAHLPKDKPTYLLLQYTDNRDWVEGTVKPELAKHLPLAEIMVRPLSLTTGAHTGPGTWAIAMLPKNPTP